MDSQVSTNYEPSVSVAGDGDASVPMEPEGVTMASSISAAVRVDGNSCYTWYSFESVERSMKIRKNGGDGKFNYFFIRKR